MASGQTEYLAAVCVYARPNTHFLCVIRTGILDLAHVDALMDSILVPGT